MTTATPHTDMHSTITRTLAGTGSLKHISHFYLALLALSIMTLSNHIVLYISSTSTHNALCKDISHSFALLWFFHFLAIPFFVAIMHYAYFRLRVSSLSCMFIMYIYKNSKPNI